MVSLSLLQHLALAAVLILSTPKNVCLAFRIQQLENASCNSWPRTGRRIPFSCPARFHFLNLNAIRSDQLINGDNKGAYSFLEGIDVAALPEGGDLVPPESPAPPMSFNKYLTMQEKRAVVTIRYSGDAGLKPYFLTLAKKLKAAHPDIVVERLILPAVADGNEATFEVLVDGKVVMGKSRPRKVTRGVVDMHMIGRRSVYVSMGELDLAISRARRKHRPSTVYGDDGSKAKLPLREGGKSDSPSAGVAPPNENWSD
jgi:hypothetical protein